MDVCLNLDRRLLHQARQNYAALVLTVALGFTGGVLTVLQAGYLSQVVARVFLGGQPLGQVAGLLSVLLAIFVLRASLVWAGEMSANAIAAQVKLGLRKALVADILRRGPVSVRGERTGELVNVVVEGIESLDAYFSQYLPGLALAALVPLTILFFIIPIDPLSGIVLLLTAPLIPVFMILIGNAAQALTRRQWTALSRMSAYFLDVLQGLAELKTLGRSKAQIQVISDVSERFCVTTMGVLRVTFLSALVLEMVSTLSTAVVAVEVGLRLLSGSLAFEQAFFILILAPEFYFPLRMLGTRFHAGISGVEASKRIFEFLKDRNKVEHIKPDCGRGDSAGHAAGDVGGLELVCQVVPVEIRFEDVSFAYEDGRLALVDANFEIPAGAEVALVGPSGGGKTTTASLLLRFVHPMEGRILAGGRHLDEIPLDLWRSRVAYLPQNPYLFNDTVAANIRLARPEADMQAIVRAAEQAHAHEFIQALPHGYETPIGERGTRLSAGQAQRIALARAFLQDAWLVVLDEPSANLDPENEAMLQESLARLLEGRSVLIIAHRLNTITRADRVVVLEQGRVIQQGEPAKLAAEDGLFRRMLKASGGGPGLDNQSSGPLQTERGLDVDNREGSSSLGSAGLFHLPAPEVGLDHASLSLDVFWRMIRLAAPFKGLIALSILMGVATILSGVGLMAASAYIISAAALHPSIAELQVAIVGVRFFGISRGIFRYLERYLSHQATLQLLARLRIWFYKALEPLAPARLMSQHSGDLLARILGDIESLQNFYVRALAPPLTAIVAALTVCVFLSCFDPRLGLALALIMFAAGVGVPLLIRTVGKRTGRQFVALRAALNAALVDTVQGLADLLACGRQDRQMEQIEGLSRSLAHTQCNMAALNGLQTGLSGLLANLGMWVVLWLAIPLVRTGHISGVYLAVLALASLSAFEAVAPLPLASLYLESNLQAARRLFEVVDARPAVQDPVQPARAPEYFGLRVEQLRFRYPIESLSGFSDAVCSGSEEEERAWVIDGLSFELPVGGKLAIVGPSGAGKSTLARLLLRFWDYQEGAIFLDGSELRRFTQDDIRQRLAVVSQNAYLFSASVRDNLRLARPSAVQAEIEAATGRAQIGAFIQSLPEGYETWIGEQGLRLSGGERQRLAIARALLREAPLLILDEPTANLDALTERQVLSAIDEIVQGRTMLLITHRLVGMEAMDEIIVLDRGRAVERGRHAELLELGGLYRRMWDLQRQVLVE